MALKEEIKAQIRKYALKNAFEYGEARVGNVLGKVVMNVPRSQIDELKSEIEKRVREVNSLPRNELESEYRKYEPEFREQYEKKVEATSKPKMALEGATKGDFITRFPPEPSGYMYLGHAKPALLEQEFARIYEGKLFLYWDDTNPEKEKQEFVDAFKSDLEWLGIKFDREYYASDNIEKIYSYARKLLKDGHAYACECDSEKTKRERFEGIECEHRKNPPSENLERFEMMLQNRYNEGDISIMFRVNMKSNNTAIRDPTILRIKKDAHYRQGKKYVVWPTYDLNTPINDSINGVTDVIRSKEYELRDELDKMILDALGLRKPRVHSEARLVIKGQPKSKRVIRRLIDDGLIKDYDDPRLVTIVALKRRGIRPEAIRKFVLNFGMSKMDTVVGLSALLAENKRLLDSESKRLFYVQSPVGVEVKDLVPKEVEIELHPTNRLGSRSYEIRNRFYISGEDASKLKPNDVIRLKRLFSLKVNRVEDYLIGEITESETDRQYQWVCDGSYVKCEVLVPSEPLDERGNFNSKSLELNSGYAERYVENLKEHEIIQFERFGFCILDNKREMRFILISR